MKLIYSLLVIPTVLFSSTMAQADTLDTSLLQSLGEVKYHELESTNLGRPFHIFVDLPEDYQQTDHGYPTVYLLDGGNTLPLMAAHHHYRDP